jgi:Leucine-rich repeat (LRR) protein
LPHLEILDLSLNQICSLKFLEGMKFEKLKTLYLNNNKINNISPLMKINEDVKNADKIYLPKLSIISLKNNNFDPKEEGNKAILRNLKNNKKITSDIS